VRDLFEDADGNLWVGTEAGGLNAFFPGTVDTFTRDEGLDSDRTTAIAEDGLGGIWIGTAGEGLNRMLGNVVFTHNSRMSPLVDDYINTLMLDRNQQLWIGTNKGITIWSGRNFKPFEGNGWTGSRRVHGLYQDSQGTVWIGTENGAFYYRDGQVQMVDDISGFQPRLIEDFLEEPGMGVWAASRSGLVQIRNHGIVNVMTKRDGLGDNNVVALYRDSVGVLWFGTIDGGLHILREHRIFALTTQHGLPSDSVLHIEEDDQRNLWMSSDKGIFAIAKSEMLEVFDGTRERVEARVFDIDDGMLSMQGAYGSSATGIKTSSGKIWFATTRGAVRIDPDVIDHELPLPDIFLESVRYGTENKRLEGPPYLLPAAGSRFEIRYTAPAFHPSQNLKFSTILEGHDDTWSPLSSRLVAQYSNVSPGKYRFKVRVADEHQHFSEQILEVAIEKEPHFYQTIWFYSVCILIAALLANALYQLRIRQLMSRQEALTRLVDDRTAQLLEANQRLVEQTLTDPLTGLHNRRFLKEQLDKDVAQVHRFYQLVARQNPDKYPNNADILFIFVDLDHFKSINDTYGHLIGDQVLLEITDLLRLACRETDSVIRWGGEEFLILARNSNRDQAPLIAERVRKMIAEHFFNAGDEKIQRTCSVGFAAYPLSRKYPEAVHWERVVDMADNALYAAKYSGRNAWVGINVPGRVEEEVVRSLTSNTMEELALAGLIEVLSSLPDDKQVKWHRDDESANKSNS
jgi:diguanylate cyclase (GGDEF)-like protein